MKIICIIFLGLIWPTFSLIAGSGSFLVTKTAYFYTNSQKSGKKILTRKHQAYEVIGLKKESDGSIVFKVLVEVKRNTVVGSGYIIENDDELQAVGSEKIKVYPSLPNYQSDLTDFRPVSSRDLLITGRQQKSPDFPNIIWRAVNYKTNASMGYWIDEWAGIYRLNKDYVWFNDTYNKVIKKKYKKNIINKILIGIVEPGFDKEQVILSLGKALKENQLMENNQVEWIYQDRRIIFENNLVVRVL